VTNDGRIERAAGVLRTTSVEGTLQLDASAILHAVAGTVDHLSTTRHPLGFIHIDLTPLASVEPNERLRLHIWTEESRACTDGLGLVHDHVWEGKSFMLAGSLTNSLMRVVRSATGRFTMSEVAYVDGEQFVNVIDKDLELKAIEQNPVNKGSWYFLPRRVIHATEINCYPTATLVLAKYLDSSLPRLVSQIDPEPGPRSRREVPANVTLSALTEVLAAVE